MNKLRFAFEFIFFPKKGNMNEFVMQGSELSNFNDYSTSSMNNVNNLIAGMQIGVTLEHLHRLQALQSFG